MDIGHYFHSFSAVQIHHSIVRKGTRSIKLCEAQDQGPQRRAHSREWVQCLLVIRAQSWNSNQEFVTRAMDTPDTVHKRIQPESQWDLYAR